MKTTVIALTILLTALAAATVPTASDKPKDNLAVIEQVCEPVMKDVCMSICAPENLRATGRVKWDLEDKTIDCECVDKQGQHKRTL